MGRKVKNTEELVTYGGNYSEPKFWSKMARTAKRLGREPVRLALILYYVMLADSTSLKDKAVILGALGYLILPVDLIPDFIPLLGFTDDIAALTLAFKAIRNSVTPEIEAKAAAKLAEWF